MVCEGTWRFWGCARWRVDDGEWLKTQLTRFGVMAGAVLPGASQYISARRLRTPQAGTAKGREFASYWV